MRGIVFGLCVALLSGCGFIAQATGWTRPVQNPQNSYLTSTGVRIDLNRGDIFRHFFENGDFQLERVNLTDHGRVRVNPKFAIAKPGISSDTAMDAAWQLMRLDRIYAWPSTYMLRYSASPERLAYLDDFQDQALIALIETALAFEAATTEEEYSAGITAAEKRIEDFKAKEPDS